VVSQPCFSLLDKVLINVLQRVTFTPGIQLSRNLAEPLQSFRCKKMVEVVGITADGLGHHIGNEFIDAFETCVRSALLCVLVKPIWNLNLLDLWPSTEAYTIMLPLSPE
jgi:hypothetical protein